MAVNSVIGESQDITLGVGYFYIIEYDGTIPENNVFETSENMIGHTSGGAEIQYTPEYTEIIDDNMVTVMNPLTKETAILKTGALSWSPQMLQLVCKTAVVDSSTEGVVKVTFGGKENNKNYLIRFVHIYQDGSKFRATILGTPNSGFSLAYKTNEPTILNMEFKAISMLDGDKYVLGKFEREAKV